ncbi:nuclear transport factor 2 family protein [Myxococcota bacterium]|nr:nuclear transport factor 2 family protein [Myxococcota bacterium]
MTDTLQRLADEAEIRNLLARIAQLADEGELDDYVACFTPSATWGGAGFPERRGHAAILAGARERRAGGTAGPGSKTRHLISTSVVELDGDRARTRSIFLFYRDTTTTPTLDRMGVWEDVFARTESGWKLAARTISQPE